MGRLETESRIRYQKRQLQQLTLQAVRAAGLLGIGLIAPNVIGAMKKLGILPKLRQREYISTSASKLAKRGYLKFEGGYYQLTPSGEALLRRWEMQEYKLPKQKKWDKRWRVIIFDIPEKKRRIRKQISSLLNQAGMYRLQDSVWVFPYECEDVIGLMKTDFGVGRELLYMIVDSIENDKHLRKEFDLLS